MPPQGRGYSFTPSPRRDSGQFYGTPVRRDVSVDGLAPRTVQRPAPIKDLNERPQLTSRIPGDGPASVLGSTYLNPNHGAAPQAPAPQLSVPNPVWAQSVASSQALVETSRPEPSFQPQPVAPPPVAPVVTPANPVPQSVAATPPPVSQPQMPAAPILAPLDFTPPPKLEKPPKPAKVPKPKRSFKLRRPKISSKKLGLIAGIIVLPLALGGGGYAAYNYYSDQNNPDVIFSKAIINSLSTTQVERQTTQNNLTNTADFDFSSLKNPLVSTKGPVSLAGGNFTVSGYGSLKNNYISYNQLPVQLPASAANGVDGRWIQIRLNGELAESLDSKLLTVADPRSLLYAPVIFGNFTPANRTQLANYITVHNIYKYDRLKVHKTTLNGQSVWQYPVVINNGYLQIYSYSAAANQGLSPADITSSIANADGTKDITGNLYIAAGSHQIVRLDGSVDGQSVRYDFSKFDSDSLPTEPPTKLYWSEFENQQLQIESQLGQALSASERDSLRQANLDSIHAALASYFTQNAVYPSLANLNDPIWLASHLPALDPHSLRDPQSASLQLLGSLPITTATKTVVKGKTVTTAAPATPTYAYAYQPTNATGQACSDVPDGVAGANCTEYKLTASLSTGKTYIVQNP